MRSGGTLPVLAAFSERGIPAIVSGFSLPDDALHAPNESFRLVALDQGAAAARALYQELADAAVSELEAALETLRALPKPQRRAAALLVNRDVPARGRAGQRDGPAGRATRSPPRCWLGGAGPPRARPELVAGLIGRLYDWRGRGQPACSCCARWTVTSHDGLMQLVFELAGAPWRGQAFETLRGVALRRRGETVRASQHRRSRLVAGGALARPGAGLQRGPGGRAPVAAGPHERRRARAAQVGRVRRARARTSPARGLLTDEALDARGRDAGRSDARRASRCWSSARAGAGA